MWEFADRLLTLALPRIRDFRGLSPQQFDEALDVAREAKESTFGSFDLLVTRIGQRTNDIMKLLTLVTVILLPATVLGGIMGMNFQVGLFDLAWVFWVVIATMLAIAPLPEPRLP
jgi:Mg2+ and Co2+ transporter CorA